MHMQRVRKEGPFLVFHFLRSKNYWIQDFDTYTYIQTYSYVKIHTRISFSSNM
jgi:hypothetical protein